MEKTRPSREGGAEADKKCLSGEVGVGLEKTRPSGEVEVGVKVEDQELVKKRPSGEVSVQEADDRMTNESVGQTILTALQVLVNSLTSNQRVGANT